MILLNFIKILWKIPVKKLLPVLIGVLASVAVLLLWHQLTIKEQLHIEQLIQQEADAIELQLSQQLTSRVQTLERMAKRWESNGGITQDIWKADATALIEDFYDYQAIEWVDSDFQLRWVVPQVGNEAVQNLDLSQERRRRITLRVARDLDQVILTRHIFLVQGGQGFLATVPLYVDNNFDGFIVGVFRFQTLLDNILRVPTGYKVAIYDGRELVYCQPGFPDESSLQKTGVVQAYGANWRVVVAPTKALISEAKSSLPIIVLFGGLVLVWLFVLVVHLVQLSRCHIYKVQNVNRKLKWEIHQRKLAEIDRARLAAIVESSEDAIISKNLEDNITSWNAGAERIFGYTASEMIGQSGKILIPPDYQEEEQEIIQKIIREERIEHYDTQRLRKDGSLIDVSISVSPIKDETGYIIGASKIARNIAERKQAEAALRQSEERWELALKGNNDGIWDWNVQTNEVFFSSRWKEMLGYKDDEIENKIDEWEKRVHPDDLESVTQVIQDHFAQKTPFYLSEHRVRCKDGSYKWILDRGQALWDNGGNVIRMTGSHTDITERKKSEEALRQSEARYRQLINNLSAGFVIHAPDTSILLCNLTACELLGLSTDQMMGKTAINPAWYFLREDGSIMPQEEYPVNRVLSSKKPLKNYVLGIYNGAQNLTWVLVNAYPEFEENGKIKQIVITFINITKRKQAEEEIKQTRNFLQALLDHLPVAVFVKNANPDHFGVIQFWNKTSEQLFGISAEQAIGQTVYEFFPVEQASFFDQKDREAFLKGEIEDIPEELIDSYSLGRRWLHTVKVPVYNEQHQPQYLLCFSEDITERKRVQAERLELTQVMENALSGISKLDTQGCYVYVNKTYANIAGYQPEEMIGISWQKTVHPDELEKMIAAYQQMVKIGRVEVETTGIRKDGSIFYKELVMIASYDEDRQLLGHYCFMKDISERQAALRERKQAEMNLAQELLRTQTLFNTSIDGIVVMNNQGDVVQASTSFAQMLGYSLEEALTLNVVDWDAQWTKEELEIMLAREEVIPLFETRHRRKDGSEYDVEISWNRVELDGEMMNFCICRNISERKQIEEALQYQKEIFQTIVNNIPVMITLFNSKGQIELINPELERVLGWPLETWQQKDILSKCYPDPVYCESVLEHMLAANGKWKDMTTLTATGEKIETSWANVRLSSGYCLGIGQDITERKQKELTLQQAMETAEAANLAKSLFLANMSHELRTPLNVILGFAQVMAHDSALTPAQKQDLQTIQRSGDHLLSLINDVLDLSKIESGHCTLDETGFDLIALLHSLRNMLAERASSKGLDLSFEIAPEVPQFIIADAQKLRQVLINLISNGIKFTEKGMVTLRVKSQEFTQINTLIFEVEDTGVGISQEELETIFDAFVQATAGKRSVSGTGLGLTISRKLVELMGGKISVRSKIGKGSLFTFSLPVCLTNGVDLTPEQSDRQVIALVPGQPHHRILVVDDRAENRLLMVRLLEQLGLEVYQASNGQEAVQLWKQWLPDLIWMDIRMPILDGYEATKQIRAMEQGQKSIIIALTAQASHSDRALALAAGCNDYISKPFREQTLFIKMGEYLGLQYIYQEQKTGYSDGGKESFTGNLLKGKSENNTSKPDINLTLLAKLPGAWLTQLEDAAICGNDLAIAELVEQLSPEFARLGTRLTELANQYQFEKIIDLISSRVSEKLTTEIESSFSTVSD